MGARDPQVMIIGAGAAGLAAAVDLAERGIPSRVLEARPRTFGRVDTVRDPAWGGAIERGAEFLHGDGPASLGLAGRAGLHLETVPEEHYWVEQGRVRRTPDMEALLHQAVARERRRHRDRSLAEVLAALTPARRRKLEPVRFFVEGYHAADLGEVSAKSLAEIDAGGVQTQRRVVAGYDQVLRTLAERVAGSLQLNTTVTAVHWRRGSVRLECAATDTRAPLPALQARACVVTVPLGVLQAGLPAFSPRPPAWAGALRRLEVGLVEKIVFLFREAFWMDSPAWRRRRKVPTFWHARDVPFPTWWTAAPRAEPRLTGWAGGPAARSMRGVDDDGVVELGLASLATMLGVSRATVARALVAAQRHDWTSDPFSRGAYGYVGVGGSSAQRALGQAVEDTLILAGEALDPDRTGTVEGALASGRRAARRLIKKKRRRSAA